MNEHTNTLNADTVKQLAHEAGFDLCGVTTPEVIPKARKQYSRWINQGLHGEMDYLASDIERRSDPSRVMPDAKSIIMLGLNYYQPNSRTVAKGQGRVSRYARGRDYHKIIEKKVKTLIASLEQPFDREPAPKWRWFVDYGPLLERSYAEEAGLGFISKNGMLINGKFGSWVFLAEIVTDLEIEPDNRDPISHGKCGACRLCIEACPTEAILSPRRIDSQRCISYLTIERPSEVSGELGKLFGDLVFGCDICQEVCPHNEKSILTTHDELLPGRGIGEFLDLKQVLGMESREEFLELTAGTPLTRPRLAGLKRNAEIVMLNQDNKSG